MTDSGDENDYVPPRTPFDYISRDQLYDLWGAGFTVIRRGTFGMDLYATADRICKPGMAQQWCDAAHVWELIDNGWNYVPAERYPGLYAPYGYEGEVKIGELVLLECPAHKIAKAKEDQVAAAHKLVTDWQDKYGGSFSGEVSVNGERTEIGDIDTTELLRSSRQTLSDRMDDTRGVYGNPETKTIESVTAIPRELTPYIAQIFEERDYLAKGYADESAGDEPAWSTILMSEIAAKMEAAMKASPAAPKWPMLNAIVLPYAVENIRQRITEEADSAKAS